MKILINFTYPEFVSKGKSYDKLNVKILNNSLFRSEQYNIFLQS